MSIQSLFLRDFRNYSEERFSLDEGVTVLLGSNAQGKTNALEAVYYVSRLRSFRTNSPRETIREGAAAAIIEADFLEDGRERKLRIELFREGRPRVFVSGVPQKRLADAANMLLTVLFSPDDVGIVREGASRRRAFLDAAIGQLRPRYAAYLSEYQSVLLHKQRALEHEAFAAMIDDYNLRLAHLGGKIAYYRSTYVARLAPHAALFHKRMAAEEALSLLYESPAGDFVSAPEAVENLLHALSAKKRAERAARKCLTGIQRDELLLSIHGRGMKLASQGQARTAALALKLGEKEMVEEQTGQRPVLLLDDVLSELDGARQKTVLEGLAGGQCILTCCERPESLPGSGGKTIAIEGGRVVLSPKLCT